MIGSAMAVRFPAGAHICSAVAAPYFRPFWSSDEAGADDLAPSRRVSSSGGCNLPWQRCRRFGTSNSRVVRRSVVKSSVRGSLEPFGSEYHPSEDIGQSMSGSCNEARLTAPETARTITEVNSKALIWFPDLSDDDSEQSIEELEQTPMWPELPYVTDKYGNIYFQVNSDEDFLQKLTSENNMVQAVIGLDAVEMMYYLEFSDINLGTYEIEDYQDSDDEDENKYDDMDEDVYDDDDEYENEDEDEDEYQDWVSVHEDLEDTGEMPSDWATLETMRKTHPLFFAKRLTEAVSDDPEDMMVQPPSGLAIQGLLKPDFFEEHFAIKRRVPDLQSIKGDKDKIEKVVEDEVGESDVSNDHGDELKLEESEEAENNGILTNGVSFYKLEMVKIVLLSPHGRPVVVEIEDFAKAQPDTLARSAAKMIFSLNAGGEKTVQALKSLCWRCKGIQVEEAVLVGLDSLGLDVRVCSGTQVQTLRFSFGTRVTSLRSAKRQISDMLFPGSGQKPPKKKQNNKKER